MFNFNVILFNDFETLDAFGPAEVIGKLDKIYELGFYSLEGGIIKNSQNVKIETNPIKNFKEPFIILIPGGIGTRKEVNKSMFIEILKELSIKAQYVLSVCTGAALLAKTGLLKNLKATTNKMAYEWVTGQDKDVIWVRKARWINDGKFYTSSGITAGIDMALGFVKDRFGIDTAEKISKEIEYIWNKDENNDPFC